MSYAFEVQDPVLTINFSLALRPLEQRRTTTRHGLLAEEF
jgi:hypothetical protein